MLEAAKAAISFVAGRQRADLDGDAQLRFAVIHAIELVGEASRHVSEELRARHPELPWRQIGATRNRIAHGYWDVDLDIAWQIVTADLPPLIGELERIIASDPPLG
jgi:uncharacterized protein with HEPN domain